MENLQFECKEYKLYSPDSLKYITDNMYNILISKIREYKELFDVEHLEQIQINYFDDKDKFRNYIYKLRGESKSLPEYATGTYDNDMVNTYIEKDIPMNSIKYQKRLYTANHELFHILYKKYILKGNYQNRIIWYDEGMAQFFSGEKDYILDKDSFKNFYSYVKGNTKYTPNLNIIKHGSSFVNDLYNGYDLSYLCVRYLSEILNSDEFKALLSNFDRIREYGTTIVENMFTYYDNKLNIGGKLK